MKKTYPTLTGSYLMRIKSCLMLMFFSATLCAAETQEVRKVASFDGLTLKIPADVTLKMGAEQSVSLTADEADLKEITTEIQRGDLLIRSKKRHFRPRSPIKIAVEAKEMQAVKMFGKGSLKTLNAIKTAHFSLTASGHSTIHLEVDTKSFFASLLGLTEVTMVGKAESQLVKITGDSKYFAKGFETEIADLNISGSGKMDVNVKDRMQVKVRGKGKITYVGTPTIVPDISGMGVIQKSEAEE